MDLFRVQIGSVPLEDGIPESLANVFTIVWVVHQPSGQARLAKRAGEASVHEVIESLQEEILEDLRQQERITDRYRR